MYIISVRRGNQAYIKGYNYRIQYWIMVLYYKLKKYEINYGDD